ncbi:hypothetical protein FJNA_01240 [Thermus sp. FJN-A]
MDHAVSRHGHLLPYTIPAAKKAGVPQKEAPKDPHRGLLPGWDHSPRKLGARFSKKAWTPSFMSWVAEA